MTIAIRSFTSPIPGLSAGAAAAATGVSLAAIQARRPGCRRPVARARQLAVYFDHVVMGSSVSACARFFERDRATIRHAIARVEDRRENTAFDLGANRLEKALARQRDMVLALLADSSEGAGR